MSKRIILVKKNILIADKKMDQIVVRQINKIKIQQLEFIMKASNKRSSKKQKTENSPYYEIKGHREILFALNKNWANTTVRRLNATSECLKNTMKINQVVAESFPQFFPLYHKNQFDTPFYFSFANVGLQFPRTMTEKEDIIPKSLFEYT